MTSSGLFPIFGEKQNDMYHNIYDSLLKRNLYDDSVEPGRYYVLLSDTYMCCFTHVLQRDIAAFEADTLYVHYTPKQHYFHSFFGAYVKAARIPASVFRQALQLYEKCKKEILSLEFDKELLTGFDKNCQYYYLTNVAGDVFIFGNIITENDQEMMELVGVDTNVDKVATNVKPVSSFEDNLRWYRIDAKTYEKAKKIHDMVDHTLATMLVSYLRNADSARS